MKSQSSVNIYDSTQKAWDAMYQVVCSAKKSIYWEVYIFMDDDAGHRFFEKLKEKSRAGVDVKLIIDFWGSYALSRKSIADLKKAGIELLVFRQKKFSFKHFRAWWMDRTHRKILIVDEKIGFIGGVNVGKEMTHWQDIQVQLRGKVVRSLLRSFARTYIMCGGNKKNVKHLLKYKYRVADENMNIIYDNYGRKKSRTHQLYLRAMKKARERVVLFSPYYFPDKELLQAMWDARKRGVKIDLVIPFRTDLKVVTWAAYAWFAILSKKGVRIHLMKKKMMHGKGIIVDDDWTMIGSTNLEHGSLFHSHEANVQFKQKRIVKKMKRVLERWIKSSELFDLPRWQRRKWFHRLRDNIAAALYKFWFRIK